MRLHRLEITAFGPFSERVVVDFDALSGAGLFLLSGPTGAGKTSVLDAVCFALYGDVPGDRAVAKRLRCDRSPEGVAPRVVLEATLSGRRFLLDRSPAWERPKRRGTGTTTQQAHVVVSERIEGEWVPLSTRIDETGHLVSRLLGMTLTQFCQVAMLPQGRFQAFLRARSEERHALLQQIFRTARFDRVEGWLRDHRLSLRRRCDDELRALADLASRLSETAGFPLPEGTDVRALTGPAAEGELATWASELVAASADAAAAAEAELARATGSASTAREELRRGLEVARLAQTHHAATAELARLDARSGEHEAAVARVQLARQAEGVRPLLELGRRAADDLGRARQAVAAALDVDGLRGATRALLAGLRDDLTGSLERVQRLGGVEAEAAGLETQLRDLDADRTSLEAQLDGVVRQVAELPEREAAARAAREESAAAAAALPAAAAELDRWREAHAAHRLAGGLASQLEAARAELQTATDRVQALKETWLRLREERLDGMAAEIAGALVVGGCCPVCGSHDHPSPARPSPGAPDAAAEKAARALVDDAEVDHLARTERVRDLTTRLALARATAGEAPDSLAGRVADAEATLASLQSLADRADGDEAVLARLVAAGAELADEATTLRGRLAGLASRSAVLRSRLDDARAELEACLSGTGCDDLTSLAASLVDRKDAVDRAIHALEACERAQDAHDRAAQSLAEALDRAGFADAAAAETALLAPDDLLDTEAAISEHVLAVDRARRLLDDPAVVAAAGATPPDVDALHASAEAAEQALTTAHGRRDLTADRATRVRALADELAAALAAWLPLHADLGLVTSLASFVEGKSPDNQLQMRLSAYVLAHRLSQVVDAANARLRSMSDQRYTLEHTGRRGAGETRGGLSLLVRDEWSGESRDPATLSGGETFVISLALALGLADVITQEAGGADLDTLFVDEGFGSLDADTLDDVMDTLDSLRDGGRVVGVVSHVAEMQTRIPTQLRIVKERGGSRVVAVTG
ncbi:SMC family ATPase [Nocardioides gansuensis]|uniref:Nuclease SbcCD subunit C n=1 Tax=Nocardioides gansuensis TaxID=2138300 RepID=A0A2T8FE29_9ACTN|nr:SMC family ATPase [Nocardioides gansuensis]PVG83953.1 SMC family ATPase [Nocardioides gansuensis]